MGGCVRISDRPDAAPLRHYLIALGSNQRHHIYGRPAAIIRAALDRLSAAGTIEARSTVIASDPVGPSQRDYANSAAIISSALTPHAMLEVMQSTERMFGRRRRGQSWSARVLDLDIILYDGGIVADGVLSLPHPQFRRRGFVLGPATQIAGDWRDPITGLAIKHLNARLTKPHPAPR